MVEGVRSTVFRKNNKISVEKLYTRRLDCTSGLSSLSPLPCEGRKSPSHDHRGSLGPEEDHIHRGPLLRSIETSRTRLNIDSGAVTGETSERIPARVDYSKMSKRTTGIVVLRFLFVNLRGGVSESLKRRRN